MKILVTGGAGFIGSALVRFIVQKTDNCVVNVDKLTYAGNLDTLSVVEGNDRYYFEKVDICDQKELTRVFAHHQPDMVMHLAAESHVDNSIGEPTDFINTNIVGTYTLLEVARRYWKSLEESKQLDFKFIHVSTDEVYGDLKGTNDLFTEATSYNPSSPYSASKAASDHLVRAWYRTYGLPTLVTNCSNNYGPFQHSEKFIPRMICNALKGEALPIYGDGQQIRDWLYVDDHVRALYLVAKKGKIGDTYNIGGINEWANIDVVRVICDTLDVMFPEGKPDHIDSFSELIIFVNDRPGHDLRYAIDANKIYNTLGWRPTETFESGLRKTIEWYVDSFQNMDGKSS